MSEIKDFSRTREQVAFTIDGDKFEAAPAIPAETLAEFVVRYSDAGEATDARTQLEILAGVLELVLLPDSYTLLKQRMRDRERPVELDQLDDIITWLTEKYGLRPTQESPDSSDGQPAPESGTNSTAPTPVEGSTSQASLPIAS